MKNVITIAAVPYSANLGDGIIHESMENIFVKNNTFSLNTIDIAGRDGFQENQNNKINNNRVTILNILTKMPKFIRQSIVSFILSILYFKKYKKYYIAKLSNTKVLILGGGQLFSDVDLNFPLKIYFLYRVLKSKDIPIVIYAVGVSENWSFFGKLLFLKVINSKNVLKIFTRDTYSKNILNRYTNNILNINEVWDPGILISEKYPKDIGIYDEYVGIGLSSPVNLKHSGDNLNTIENNLIFNIIKYFHDKNYKILLFTNGASEDEIYKDNIFNNLSSEITKNIFLAEAPKTPYDLCKIISKLHLVVSHRLHANIIAYSYKVPSIGLMWDKKLESFFEKINRKDFLISDFSSNIEDKFENLLSYDITIDKNTHAKNLKNARIQLESMYDEI